MTEVKDRPNVTASSERQKDIFISNRTDKWAVSLPPNLKVYQNELESLLGKVFAQKPMLPENVALAQQMSLNWCASKCREVGISLEDAWRE